MINRVKSTTKINKTKKSLFVLQFSVSENCNKREYMVNTGSAGSEPIIGKLCIWRVWNSGGKSIFDHRWSARIFVTHTDWIATLIRFLVLWGWHHYLFVSINKAQRWSSWESATTTSPQWRHTSIAGASTFKALHKNYQLHSIPYINWSWRWGSVVIQSQNLWQRGI